MASKCHPGSLGALCRLYRDDATFLSKSQKQLVEIALGQEENVVAIIPTRGGKSVAWLIPVLLEEDIITAVVIPFMALLLEQLSTARSHGILAEHWTASDYLERGHQKNDMPFLCHFWSTFSHLGHLWKIDIAY